VHKRDLDRVMSHYAPDVVAFDAIQALQFKGRQAYQEHWKMCLDMCGGALTMTTRELDIQVEGSLAVAHAIIRCAMDQEDGSPGEGGYSRMTTTYRRKSGIWLIVHEHFSAPIDMATGRAMWELAPEEAGGRQTVRPIPLGMNTITPHLVIDGAAQAIELYKKAFGAEEGGRLAMPDGKIMHAALRVAGSPVFLTDEMPQCNGSRAPTSLGGTSVTLHLYVTDVDAAIEKAHTAGCTVIMPAADMFWGDRYGVVQDPYGHRWSIASHIRDLSTEEIAKGAQQMMAQAASR